jgi:hypothetical protein
MQEHLIVVKIPAIIAPPKLVGKVGFAASRVRDMDSRTAVQARQSIQKRAFEAAGQPQKPASKHFPVWMIGSDSFSGLRDT